MQLESNGLNEEQTKEFISMLEDLRSGKYKVKYFPVNGIRIASGSKSRLVAICRKCEVDYKGEIIKDEGKAGVYKCDWCGCLNLFALSEEEQLKHLPEPVLTVNVNDGVGMALLKDAIGKDALDKAFAEADTPEEAWKTIGNNLEKAQEELDAYRISPERLK